MANGQADGQVVFEVVAETSKIKTAISNITQTFRSEGAQWDKETKTSTDAVTKNFDSMSKNTTSKITDLTKSMLNLAAKGITKMMDYSDAVDKGSKSMGISAKAYQELDYAMSMSGANIETLTRGVGNLNSALHGTASKEIQEALSGLGFSDDALSSMSSAEELLDGVLYRLAGLDDQAARADIANKLFGVGAGSQLAAFLGEGEEGIKALRQQAEDLGIVQTDEAIAQAVKTKDSIDTLNKTLDAVLMQAIIPLLPLIQSLVEFITPFLPLATEIAQALADIIMPILKIAGIDPETWRENKANAEKAKGGEELFNILAQMIRENQNGAIDAKRYLMDNYNLPAETAADFISRIQGFTLKAADDPFGYASTYGIDFGYAGGDENDFNKLKAQLADLEPLKADVDPEVNTRTIQEQIDGQSYTVTVIPSVGYGSNGNFYGGRTKKVIHSNGDHAGSGRSFANGLDYVPYDGFFAMLHQGERIQTAAEAELYRRYGNQAPSPDLTGAVRAGMGNMQIIWRGRVVADVLSEQQGDSFRALERSGWRS